MRTDRRTFLKRAGGAITCTVLGHTTRAWAAADDSAELALKNGAIVTMSDKQPLAEAMAVRGGRILAVGPNQQIEGLISKETQIIDLAGKAVYETA
jgi:imidazolonepropionase-like amidohydrolase